MKKSTLIAILMLGIISFLSAQNQSKFYYCQANISTYSPNSGAQLDADGLIPLRLNARSFIIDKFGKPIGFNSVADFINFMGDYGWEFVQFFPTFSDDLRIILLFKRELMPAKQDTEPDIKTEEGG